MDSVEKVFTQDIETLKLYKQFKEIENIYENSLIAMGHKAQISIVSGNTNTSVSGLDIKSTKGY